MAHTLRHEAPVIKTLAAARQFLKRHAETERDHHCGYGHFGCSWYDGGPCLDETLSNFPELED